MNKAQRLQEKLQQAVKAKENGKTKSEWLREQLTTNESVVANEASRLAADLVW